MVNKNKQKGSRWEHDAVNELNKNRPGTWKRIPGSGAIGTILDMPILKGDLTGKYAFFPFKFVGEAKVGYGGSSMTIQKDWFDKVKEEAEQNFAIPAVLLKFEKSRSGVKHVIAFDFETWEKIISYVEELKDEVDKHYK